MNEIRSKHQAEPYRRLTNKYSENLLSVSFISRRLKIYYTHVGNKKKQQKYAPSENEHRHFIVTLTKRTRFLCKATLLNDPQSGATLRDVIAAKHSFLLS